MGEFWEPTAQMFGSLFEKPKMSGKLLSKPPFYYILDIIQETLKVTGYPKGLYSQEEFDRLYYVTKDQKLQFLQKIIVLTQMTLEEKIIANPTRIIAGLEPELTNHFLQAVYRAAMSGNDFNPYIEKSQKQKEITAKNQGVADQATQVQIILEKKHALLQDYQIINIKLNQDAAIRVGFMEGKDQQFSLQERQFQEKTD